MFLGISLGMVEDIFVLVMCFEIEWQSVDQCICGIFQCQVMGILVGVWCGIFVFFQCLQEVLVQERVEFGVLWIGELILLIVWDVVEGVM